MSRSAAFYLYLAERCREYISKARTQIARDQFELWLIEFEAQAEEVRQAESREEPRQPG